MNLQQFMGRLGGTESGGNYNARNGRTGAAGKYQILPSNWPSWSREAGLGPNAPRTPANQEKVASFKMQQYFDQFGSWDAVAVAWYAGPSAAKAWLKNPDAPRFNKKQGNGNEPSINEYVRMVSGGAPADPGERTVAAATAEDDEELTPQSSPQEIENYIRRNYPDVAAFVGNPELRRVMVEAALADEDDVEVLARLQRTDYWQNNSPSSRAFDELIGRNDGKAGQVVDTAKGILSDAFARLGVQATDQQVGEVAKKAIRAGWINLAGQVVNQGALNDFAAFALRQKGQPLSGETGLSADSLASIARAYGVPVSRRFLEDKALRMLEGTYTEDLFRQEMVAKAKGQWGNDPDIVRALDQGRTVEDFFDSHRQVLAQAWEMDPSQVDIFNDPKLMEVTQFFDGEKRRAMTLGEVGMFARKDPRYAKTRAAQEQAAGFTMLLKREFEGAS